MFVLPLLVVESRCPCRDVGKAIPVDSLRLIQTAHETVGGRTLERPSCGGAVPTAETTLLLAYSATSKKSLTSSPRLDNEPNFRKQLPVTSFRQIAANRRNALRSTGPKTEAGKQQSRCNAVRHGLTAETVIGALEDAEDYQAFEATIIADYDAQSAVERELVLRLASLLWQIPPNGLALLMTGNVLCQIRSITLKWVRRRLVLYFESTLGPTS